MLSGSSAPSPTAAAPGAYYLETQTHVLYGPATGTAGSLAWGSGTSLVGPAGPAGTGVLTRAGAPAPTTGVPGDLYIDTVTDTFYGPATGSLGSLDWGSGVSIIAVPRPLQAK